MNVSLGQISSGMVALAGVSFGLMAAGQGGCGSTGQRGPTGGTATGAVAGTADGGRGGQGGGAAGSLGGGAGAAGGASGGEHEPRSDGGSGQAGGSAGQGVAGGAGVAGAAGAGGAFSGGGHGGEPRACSDAPAFTSGSWSLFAASDESGRSWNGSSLVFSSAVAAADGCSLDGYFDWMSNDQRTGRDMVRGTYHPETKTLNLATYSLTNPQGIVAADYVATYDAETDDLVGGTWTCGCSPGVWSATHVMSGRDASTP